MENPENGALMQCLNCGQSIESDSVFCRKCGQKHQSVTLEFKTLISDLWQSVFNLDNTFFRSLRYLWAPWKLTRFYVEGKRKSFLNPVRLFLLCLLLHFGILTSITSFDDNFLKSKNEYSKFERSKLYDQHLSFLNSYSGADRAVCTYADSLNKVLFKNTEDLSNSKLLFFENFNLFGKPVRPITLQDAIELSADEIFKKYDIRDRWEQLITKQMIRFYLDREGAVRYAMQNIAWGVIPVILLLGLLFKLLYFRQKRYYAEHLVFLMNVHSLSFTFVSFILLFYAWADINEDILGFVFFAVWLIMYFSMYMYYEQGIFKTLLKYLITGFSYLFLVLFFLLIAGLISLAFY